MDRFGYLIEERLFHREHLETSFGVHGETADPSPEPQQSTSLTWKSFPE